MTRQRALIRRLLLVPHSELARQFETWTEMLGIPMVKSPELQDGMKTGPSQSGHRLVQILYKGGSQLQDLHRDTTLLVATPSALAGQVHHRRADFSALQIIALDEADGMLSLPNRFASQKEIAKWHKHPPLLKPLIEEILAQMSESAKAPASRKARGKASGNSLDSLRIVAVSATANSVFRDWLVRRSGWIGSHGVLGERQMDWYDFSLDTKEPSGVAQLGEEGRNDEDLVQLQSVYEQIGRSRMPQDAIRHLLYTVDGQGGIVSDAGRAISERRNDHNTEGALPDDDRLLLAFATAFATEQVHSGLLLISSGKSRSKLLDALRELDIPATTIDESVNLLPNEPRLYVHSVDAVRGLDIPGLTHVFLMPGLAEDPITYLHVAGRVGRLSQTKSAEMLASHRSRGNVLCFVKQEDPRQTARVQRCWELLGVKGENYTYQVGAGAI